MHAVSGIVRVKKPLPSLLEREDPLERKRYSLLGGNQEVWGICLVNTYD
jgi:hypothetical protein